MSLSAESIQMCKDGHFDAWDLVDFLPVLTPLFARYGQRAVVQRCQIARANTATGQQAIDAVFAYYRGETGLIAARAMDA